MTDLWQQWGGDLVISPSGGLLLADVPDVGQQRVLRRLLTNLGDVIFHPGYGAGLPARVGEVADLGLVEGVVRQQMRLERAVLQTPEPVVKVVAATGGLVVTIRYVDAASGQPAQGTLTWNGAAGWQI